MFCRGWRKWQKTGQGHSKSGFSTLHVSNETDEKVTTVKETVLPRFTCTGGVIIHTLHVVYEIHAIHFQCTVSRIWRR